MKKLPETAEEKMLRTAKVVKIEPMPKPSVPIELPAGIVKIEDRQKIADFIVHLSDGVLSIEKSGRHFALRIGSPPNSNAVTVSKRADRVSFFIRSEDLRRKAEAEGLKLVQTKSVAPRDKDRYRFLGLGLSEIQAHETLFREIVKESLGVIMDRRPRKH